MERLSSPTLVLTSTVFKSLLVVLLFSSLVVDRCATDDDITSGSNDGLGDSTLDPEFEEELDAHSSCPHLHHYSEHTDDNSSHSCPGVQGFIKSYRVESVKRDILRKLNLDAPPNISVSTIPQVPRLQALIEKVGKDHNSYDDEPKSTFILFGKASDDETEADDECRFHLKSDLFTKRLERASLGLFVRKPKRYEAKWTGWLLISFENRLVLKKRLTMVANETNRWYTFNITIPARDWFLQRKNEILMNVVGSDSTGTPLPVVKPLQDDEENYKPYLFLKVKEPISSRLKRTLSEDCIEGDQERRCCRYPLIINFAEMGWNWIIVPASYNAYYCSGDCPDGYMGTSPYVHLKESSVAVKCCTGRKFSSISIIYFDESKNIVLSRVPNMVVEQCECI